MADIKNINVKQTFADCGLNDSSGAEKHERTTFLVFLWTIVVLSS